MRVYLFGVYLREFTHKNDAVDRGMNYEIEAGGSDSCIITMSPPPTSSTTANQNKEYVGASTHSGERHVQCTLSSRNVPEGTGPLQKCRTSRTQ